MCGTVGTAGSSGSSSGSSGSSSKGGLGRLDLAYDLGGRLSLSSIELGARWRGDEPREFAAGGWGKQGRWAAGEIELQWGAGCLLSAERVFSRLVLGGFRGAEGGPFYLRGTTAWRSRPCQGGALQIPVGSLIMLGWAGRWDQGPWQAGLGAWHAGWGGMISLCGRGERRASCWSLCWAPRGRRVAGILSTARGRGASLGESGRNVAPAHGGTSRASDQRREDAAVLIELAGRAPWTVLTSGEVVSGSASADAIGATWRTPSSALLGRLTGDLHWRREDRDLSDCGRTEDGWQLDWELPVMRGMLPSLTLLLQRRSAARDPIPRIERSLRFSLHAAPWSGTDLWLTLGTQREESCRSNPDDDGERALITAGQSLLGLRARIELSPTLRLSLRFRESQASLTLDEEGLPLGLPGQAVESLESAPGEGLTHWWDRGAGSLAQLELERRGAARWSAGIALAAAPGERAGAVSVRRPPRQHQWRTLAAGAWLGEFWVAHRAGGRQWESVVRMIGGAEQPLRLVLLLGMRVAS
ncbi:MAG: hypothetical protein KAY32_14025 [Candidatus Eisenbacteria sp.]|nr:hypothetical protein [Candidatus Eisenbacteria bacterium]